MIDVALFAVILIGASLVRKRIEHLPLSLPMLFMGAGMLLSAESSGVFRFEVGDEPIAFATEFTLAMLLFADATRINVRQLRGSLALPARLLFLGLPFGVVLGSVLIVILIPDLSWAEAALMAAILTTTDAALGHAIVGSPVVPSKIRQALNVESGLNDGLAVPLVAVFTAIAAGSQLETPLHFLSEALYAIAGGLAAGCVGGWLAARLLTWARANGWIDGEGIRLVVFGAALGCFAGAEVVEVNGFLTVFAAGMVFHWFMGDEAEHMSELTEDAGQLGMSVAFVVFGALLVWPALDDVTMAIAVCVIGLLTVARIVPMWVATRGTGLRLPTVAFIGWFGPRGLASVLFGLVLLAEGEVADRDELFTVIALVVFASVVLHGMTAAPGAALYGRWYNTHPDRPHLREDGSAAALRLRGERPSNREANLKTGL